MKKEQRRYLDARTISQRLLVNGILELTSPTSLGGNDPFTLSDQPILRDHEGKPFIPGTSLTGVLRSHINEVLGGGNAEDKKIIRLFGCRWAKDDEIQSSLIVDDAPIIDTQSGMTELRDGVKIHSKTGTAEPKMKFDREFLPTGTRFEIQFELLLSGDEEDDKQCMDMFLTALQTLESGEISIGARTRRGHGKCKAGNWSYRLFDLKSGDGLRCWLALNGGVPEDWPEGESLTAEDAKDIFKQFTGYGISAIAPKDKDGMTVSITLFCPGSLIIRSGGYRPGDADAIQLCRMQLEHDNSISHTVPVLSGTSLGGVLRHRAQKIANTLAGPSTNGKAAELVEGLFGCEMGSGKSPFASKVWVDEATVEKNPTLLRHARVCIDRWRGSSLEHMLFEEDALFGGSVEVCWKIIKIPSEKLLDQEIGLMLCLVKDLFTGDLPVGGESAIGRGIVYGKEGRITINQNGNKAEINITGDGQGSLAVEEGSASSESYFNALRNHLK